MPKDAYGLDIKYHSRNYATLIAGLERFAETEAKRRILGLLKECALRMVGMIDGAFTPLVHPLPWDGNGDFPVWVGQMHDATGVGVYDDGKVVQYLPTKKALDSQPQMDAAHNDWHIIGQERLREAISAGVTEFSDGLWIVLFCAVPYANMVNTKGSPWGRGMGFFDKFSDELFGWVVSGLTEMRTA